MRNHVSSTVQCNKYIRRTFIVYVSSLRISVGCFVYSVEISDVIINIFMYRMSKYIYSGTIALLFMGIVFVSPVHAETTTSISSMVEQIKALMAKVDELQKQLATIRGEIKEVLRSGIAEGIEGDDVKKIQELLATDPSIYPQGKVTGYFGPLTKDAIKRFQEKHGLSVTGTIDDETKALLEEYLKERYGDKIPAGLLRAPGIMKKVEDRFLHGCDTKKAMGPLCKKLKDKSEDDDDDSNDDADEYEVEVEIENGTTTVSFTFDGKDYDVEIASTNLWRILDAVAEDMDIDLNDMDRNLKYEIKKELLKAMEDDEDEDEEKAKENAQDALDDAQGAIDDAEEAIDNASGDTSDAEDLLELAHVKIEIAQDAFDDERYEDAESYAEKAEGFADDAEDAL